MDGAKRVHDFVSLIARRGNDALLHMKTGSRRHAR